MTSPISRRLVVAGLSAFGGLALARNARAAAAGPTHTGPTIAGRLAAYAHSLRYDDLDEATVEAVKTRLIDSLGCAIAAFDERPVRVCRELASAGNGGAIIIGTSRRSTPDLAAFANAAAVRYYDLNDVYVGRQTGHPSGAIAAVLAVAEVEKASPQDLITAIALSYEINCRLLDAFDITPRGWDSPVCMLPAVALACGKLMKLAPEQLVHALSLAINDHIPMRQTRIQTLSDWKGLAAAEAGRNAVFATLLARAGISGPAPIFEGRAGFLRLVLGEGELNVDGFGRRGVPFRINQVGMKAYPAQVYTQTAILAGIAVAQEAGGIDRIAAVEIATTGHGYWSAGSEPEKWTPQNRDTADHSLPYVTARAMFDGEFNNDSYTADKLHDPRLLAFMRKIKVAEDPALTARLGTAVPTRVTAILDDGRRISREVDRVPGFVGLPMTRADADRKFRSNVGKRWPDRRAEAVLQSLWALDRVEDIGALLGRMTI
jgi:2-methylcitrate dehydratase